MGNTPGSSGGYQKGGNELFFGRMDDRTRLRSSFEFSFFFSTIHLITYYNKHKLGTGPRPDPRLFAELGGEAESATRNPQTTKGALPKMEWVEQATREDPSGPQGPRQPREGRRLQFKGV